MKLPTRFPTHSMELRDKRGPWTDWGTFTSDAEAVQSALSRKLAKGVRVVRVMRNGFVLWQEGRPTDGPSDVKPIKLHDENGRAIGEVSWNGNILLHAK